VITIDQRSHGQGLQNGSSPHGFWLLSVTESVVLPPHAYRELSYVSLSDQDPIARKWKAIADIARDEAEKLPPGRDRDALLKKARQLDTASHINEWLSSPGLRAPTDK